jgi:anthranilate synthase component 1
VVRELLSDWWTPVAAFHRLAGTDPHAFLLESVEGGERLGRYSFLGRRPFLIARARGDALHLDGEDAPRHAAEGPPLDALRRILAAYRTRPEPGLPPFTGGAVGYFGYDAVRWAERLPDRGTPRAAEEDMVLLFLEDVVAFDHVRGRIHLVANARVHPGEAPGPLYDAAVKRLDAMEAALFAPSAPVPLAAGVEDAALRANMSRATFEENVRRAKERIAAGDIFQVVLSQRFEVPSRADDLSLYRALRAINPSPYLFLLRLDGWSAVGSSPEPLVRVTGDRLLYRPIAGTAPRSGDDVVDAARAEALRADPKERAEHVMLVDLGRNDLGRCAVPGTVAVDELMVVERYSHVMHLVSGLSARLRPGAGPLDALMACFPAGTVSGAPKVRAMEIIEELEPDRRGLYAGAVGYVDFSGNLDTCIALRTMVVRDGVVRVQAGAGIVADSDPGKEYEETCHKAHALLEAVRRLSPEGGA